MLAACMWHLAINAKASDRSSSPASSMMVFAFAIGVLFGVYKQVSVWGFVTAVPAFAWELTLAIWLIAKGFKPSAGAMDAVSPSGVVSDRN
jgi:hypothetical protein